MRNHFPKTRSCCLSQDFSCRNKGTSFLLLRCPAICDDPLSHIGLATSLSLPAFILWSGRENYLESARSVWVCQMKRNSQKVCFSFAFWIVSMQHGKVRLPGLELELVKSNVFAVRWK